MKREAGFTLVEMLAALVVGALLLVAIGWNLSTVIRLLPPSQADERAQRLAAVAPRLEALIEQMSPSGFTGMSDRLAGSIPPPMAAGPIGPLRLTLSVRREPDGQSLYAAFQPVSEEAPWPPAARETRIIGGLRSIRFDYQAAEGSTERPLPRLVTITFNDGTSVRRVSAAPRLDNDGSCRFDPVSMTCRS